MNLQTYVISIDIGTTNLKLTLFKGQDMLSVQESRYQKVIADEERYVLDTNEIWQLVKELLKQLVKDFALRDFDLVLTSAMHTVQLLDQNLSPLGPLYTWADRTGSEWVNRSDDKLVGLYRRTGTPLHSMNPYFKLKTLLPRSEWAKVGSIKDVIIHELTGQWALDESCASSSGLYDSQTLEWDEEALKDLQLDKSCLPTVYPGNHGLPISEEMRRFLGSHRVTVYLGYSDGASSNGVFCDLEDTAVLSIGTSHAVRVLSDSYKVDRAKMNFCYKADEGRYIMGFPSNNGGNVLEWITEQFNLSFSDLEAIIQKDLDCSGVFLPYLNGERAPIWQSQAQAQYLGLTRATCFDDMIFTMVCGMFFNIKVNVEALKELQPFSQLALTGGMCRSLPLCQLLADIIEMPIYLARQANLETFGSLQLLSKGGRVIEYDVITPQNPDYQVAYALFKEEVMRHCV